MFTENNHYQLHTARQNELEATAEEYRLRSSVKKAGRNALRKRVGTKLISLGEKIAQQPKQEAKLAFSARQ
ncbi:MAG: hypothetical protein GY755_06015 [Chloroflexi bacterium]|nr:hypothetical protein [Chloroflexota bacterium]